MDFPIKNGDFPLQTVSSPEGIPAPAGSVMGKAVPEAPKWCYETFPLRCRPSQACPAPVSKGKASAALLDFETGRITQQKWT